MHVQLCRGIARLGRDRRDAVVHRASVGRQRRLQRLLLREQRAVERHAELERARRLVEWTGNLERGLRGEQATAVGTRAARGCIGGDDLLEPAATFRLVTGPSRVVRELVAGLDRRRERLRESRHVVGVDPSCRRDVAGLRIEFRGLPERGTPQLRFLGVGRGDALELDRGLARASTLEVCHRELACRLGFELVARVIAAEILEHRGRLVPALRHDEQRRGIELRRGTHRRGRGHARDAQELADCTRNVARGLLCLGLPIDRCGEAFDGLGLLRVARRQARDELCVGALGLGVVARVELRVRNHRPRDELLARVGARPQGEHTLRHH